MSSKLKLKKKHVPFLFDSNDHLNIFNLVRLFRTNKNSNNVFIDIRPMKHQQQELIASNFEVFLRLYAKLISTSHYSVTLKYSNVSEYIIDKLCEKFGRPSDKVTLIFDFQYLKNQEDKNKDPHFVKNIRGAVLLSLVQDLLNSGEIQNNISIFDETSPLLLHSASDFLNNEENSLMMWRVLEEWEREQAQEYKDQINVRIQRSLKAKKVLDKLSKELTKKNRADDSFVTFIEKLQSNIGLSKSIYASTEELHIWFVDDQHANGWYKLINKILADSKVVLRALTGLEDVEMMLDLASYDDDLIMPDVALVDLRLSNNDQVIEAYDADDLSGFQVVDLLLKHWSGLPIMITSASSKLWNMEKAIERGAVGYWRKSDEAEACEKNAVLTAFDINFQFIEKLTLALKKVRYKYIFRIIESLRAEVKPMAIRYSSFHRCINNYATELEQKTSWMCWKKTDESKINDSLFLGVMEIFNEIEPLLWNRKSRKLVLVPNMEVDISSEKSDKQIINQTLDYLDSEYDIRGMGLTSRYENCKKIRNKLPSIHGSVLADDIKHARLEDIETSLLIVWCLLNELVKKGCD